MRRLQSLVALLALVLVLGAAVYADREMGPRALGAAAPGAAPSGAWFCPHGGGPKGWEVVLEVANPGDEPATVRVRTIGQKKPTSPETLTVPPGSLVTIPVEAEGRERASMVEWFEQWVAVGWRSHAGGDEGGVAADPCSPEAGDRWLLPDGTTETKEHDDYVIVMNPFARDAVFSLSLLSERKQPVLRSDLTDVILRPFRSVAFRLNDIVLGERTVSTVVDVSVGRVVAGTLGVSTTGGIRSGLGYLGAPPVELVLPGGADAGRTDLVVMSTATSRVQLTGTLLGKEDEQPFVGLADSAPPASSGRTYPATTAGPTSVAFSAAGEGVAPARRTFGVVSDQSSTIGAVASGAWVVLPVAFGAPSNPGLVLSNPGPEAAEVTLTPLAPSSVEPITLTVPAGRTATAPKAFVQAAGDAAVLAVATSGTFVPASASYSLGREGFATYAVSLGVHIPSAWIPT